jgi:hypothetical protein
MKVSNCRKGTMFRESYAKCSLLCEAFLFTELHPLLSRTMPVSKMSVPAQRVGQKKSGMLGCFRFWSWSRTDRSGVGRQCYALWGFVPSTNSLYAMPFGVLEFNLYRSHRDELLFAITRIHLNSPSQSAVFVNVLKVLEPAAPQQTADHEKKSQVERLR